MLRPELLNRIHPDDVGPVQAAVDAARSGGSPFHVEYRIRTHQDEWRWLLTYGAVLAVPGESASQLFGFDVEIHSRKVAEAQLQTRLADAEAIFHQAETLRVMSLLAHSSTEPRKILSIALSQAQVLLGFDVALISEFDGGLFREFKHQGGPLPASTRHPRNPSHPLWGLVETRSQALCPDLDEVVEPRRRSERRLRSWLGLPLIFKQKFLGVVEFWHRSPGYFQGHQIWPAMGLADSLAETLYNARELEAIRSEGQVDPLTGLLSRKQLFEVADSLMAQGIRSREPLAVLFIDIDHFKKINDDHGHLVGDAVLMTIAQLCRTIVRKNDLLFRYGGEEFVAILPATEGTRAEDIAERMRSIAAEAEFRGLGRSVTLSIGIAPVSGESHPSFSALLAEADRAMYAAKSAGRNQVYVSHRWDSLSRNSSS